LGYFFLCLGGGSTAVPDEWKQHRLHGQVCWPGRPDCLFWHVQ